VSPLALLDAVYTVPIGDATQVYLLDQL